MTKLFSSAVLLCLLLIQPEKGNAWEWINPIPNNKGIEKIQFLNSATGYGIILNTLYKTTNGGDNWFRLSQNIRYCRYYGFLDANFGYASTDSGFCITNDGGLNWVYRYKSDLVHLYSCHMSNTTTGFFTAVYNSPSGPVSNIYYTTNQGINWYNPSYQNCQYMSDFFFLTPDNAYVAGEINDTAYFYSSSVPTAYWSRYYVPFNSPWTGIIFARSTEDLYIKYSNDFIRSTNAGVNWVPEPNLYGMSNIDFISQSTGFAAGTNTIKKTTDSGSSWISRYDNPDYTLSYVDCLSDNDIFVSGNNGSFFKSTNGGNNWSCNARYFSTNNFNDVRYIGRDTILIAGDSGKVYRTSNKGINWSTINTPTGNNLNRLLFINSTTGFVTGDSSTILKTTNAGISWIIKHTGVFGLMKDMSNADINNIFAVGFYYVGITYYPIFLKSTDCGETWSNASSPISSLLLSVKFLNSQTGFLGSFAPNIYKSTDGGNNWVQKTMNESGSGIRDIYFIDGGTGFICTQEKYIHRTTDYGETWVAYPPLQTRTLNRFCFINSSTGVLAAGGGSFVGDVGCLYTTTNAGLNWVKNTLSFVDVERVSGIAFSDSLNGIVCGQAGLLMKTTSGPFVPVNNINTDIPSGYILYQNYPNPFNQTTRIKFDVRGNGNLNEETGIVTLNVYDIIGRKVAELVNGKLNSGTHEVLFDANHLASGIYFYRLTVNKQSIAVKRMVLVK